MNIIFRKANYIDIEGIVKLCNECFDEKTSVKEARLKYEEVVNDKNQIYLVGVIDNKIVSHVKITIVPTIFDGMGSFAILNHLCVSLEYRRHNIATKMLLECEKICRKMNCSQMKLWSMNFRVVAHECYMRNGFKVVDAKFFSKDLN